MLPTMSTQSQNTEQQKPTIQKILVALDYLADTSDIFRQALELADLFQAQLYIFHCVQPQPMTYTEMGPLAGYGGTVNLSSIQMQEAIQEEVTEEMTAWLKALARQAQERNIAVNYDYQVGDPSERICQLAREWEANLIVIGRRGRQGLTEILLGSVSNYVLHHAPCSVLVVQHKS